MGVLRFAGHNTYLAPASRFELLHFINPLIARIEHNSQ